MEELRHKPGDVEEWNESYYFNFYDPRQDIGGFTRIGFKPNKREGIGYFFLFYKDEILAFHNQIEVFEVPEKIRIGNLAFFPEWHIAFSGSMGVMDENTARDVTVTLEYSPIHEEFSYLECVDEEELEIAKVVCDNHYEQIGVVTGDITVDSELYSISGFSERDHSWGERDWNAPDLWVYMTAHFDKNFGINVAKMLIRNRVIDVGFIMKNGENIPVEKVVMRTVSEGNMQKRFKYEIWTHEGSYSVTGKVLKRVQIPYKKGDKISILNENLSQFACENKKGFGIAEYLVKVQ